MANSTVTLAIFFFFFFAALISSARELRPSDHGLVFQTLSPAEAHSTPEMRSFFNSENSSPTMSSSSDVALPRAMNSGAASPPPRVVVHGDGDGDDRVGKVLKAASLVCGIVGGVLLVASAFIYLYRYPKHKQNKASSDHNQNHCESQNNDDNNNNKLQLVVRDP